MEGQGQCDGKGQSTQHTEATFRTSGDACKLEQETTYARSTLFCMPWHVKTDSKINSTIWQHNDQGV